MHLIIVEIHLDASAVVQLFSDPSNTNMCAMHLIDDYRQLLSQIAYVRIAHCFREANLCADFLAHVGTIIMEAFNNICEYTVDYF